MNRYLSFLFILCFFLFFSGIQISKKIFTYRVLQNGDEIQIKKSTVKLDKKPFVIEFTFSSSTGILVSASFEDESYKVSKSKKPFTSIPGFKATGMAESDFNKDHEIMVNNEAPNYWYYENDKSNRFDQVTKNKEGIICKRTVEQFYRVDSKETLKVENVMHNLYLVFLVKQRGKSEEADKELQRERLVIKWN